MRPTERPAGSLRKVRLEARNADAARRAAGLLSEAGDPEPLAVTHFEDGGRHTVEAYYGPDADLRRLDDVLAAASPGTVSPLEHEVVPDENWVAISQAALPPVTAGRFTVYGSHDRAVAGWHRDAIEIDAGEAFGTAHHATTRSCLIALDRLTRARSFRSVLDLGCGSGVLAIAAARAMPHAHVIATDNDPQATAVARANVRHNGAGRRVTVLTAQGLAHPRLRGGGGFDLVMANILAGPLIRMAPAVARSLAPGGIAVLSGLIPGQADAVRNSYVAAGLRVVRTWTGDGWTTLTLRRG